MYVKEIVIAKLKKKELCFSTPVQTEGKCLSSWKIALLFKDSSAVFLTKWLSVLVAFVSQKMFMRHLGQKCGGGRKGGGRVGGGQRGAVRMRGRVCLHAESANLAFPYPN